MALRRHGVEDRIRVMRGARNMVIPADAWKRGDVVCDQFGTPLRDRRTRRRGGVSA